MKPATSIDLEMLLAEFVKQAIDHGFPSNTVSAVLIRGGARIAILKDVNVDQFLLGCRRAFEAISPCPPSPPPS